MQGIVALARRHRADHIEQAARIALERGLCTCRIIRELTERIAEADRQKTPAELTREHRLVRSPRDYALFFETHAAGRQNP
jgi:hypothetical protein